MNQNPIFWTKFEFWIKFDFLTKFYSLLKFDFFIDFLCVKTPVICVNRRICAELGGRDMAILFHFQHALIWKKLIIDTKTCSIQKVNYTTVTMAILHSAVGCYDRNGCEKLISTRTFRKFIFESDISKRTFWKVIFETEISTDFLESGHFDRFVSKRTFWKVILETDIPTDFFL